MSFSTPSISGSNAGLSDASTGVAQAPRNPFSANGPFANLDLTADQQKQIASILSDAQSKNLSPSQVQSQINAVLTPTQQQQLQTDVQALQARHHHGAGHGDQSQTNSLANQLGLSSDQETQIQQLVQSAQKNGTSSSDLLSQINAVLTPDQQNQLAAILSGSAYSSTGAQTSTTPSYVLNTSA
jgi:Spy/CpxP family protein refolding chaperone